LLLVLSARLIWLFLPFIRVLSLAGLIALMTGLMALFLAPVGLIARVLLLLLVPLLLLVVHFIITSTKLESGKEKQLRDVTDCHGCSLVQKSTGPHGRGSDAH
jgi:hypothetical protein